MKISMVTGPGKAEVVEADRPRAGRNDVLVRMRACGICGSDAFYITIGGIPPRQGHTPLGHEPAGEVVEVGERGDRHRRRRPRRHQPDGSTERHHRQRRSRPGRSLIPADRERGSRNQSRGHPDHIPFEVAALNEPMAVARHGVNQCKPKPSDKVVDLRCGPDRAGCDAGVQIPWRKPCRGRRPDPGPAGQGTADRCRRGDQLRRRGRRARLIELHGAGESMFPGKAGTDIYLDAAGASAVIDTALAAAKKGATLGIVARAQRAGARRIRQRHEQRDHHRRIHGIPRRDLRGDQGSRRELGEVRA